MTSKTNDTRVSREWATRPMDQRYLSLQELRAAVAYRQENSKVQNADTRLLKVYGTEENEMVLMTNLGPKFFTNWSFSQISQVAGAPAGYLKKLPAPLAAACLNNGLQNAEREESSIMVNGNDKMRCITSTQYGRIWDKEVVDAVIKVTDGGTWKIPAASYATSDPKRASTLYASDRDVFLFLVDDQHPIEIPGETHPMFRGFYAWNSETGSQTFGLATFLYEYVCDNRIIWGVSHRSELRIRHSSGAPERFQKEGRDTLLDYANESPKPLIEQIQRAQRIQLGKDEDEVKDFLKKRGLTLAVANAAIEQSKMDNKDPMNAWAMVEGITAAARVIGNTDERVKVERIAGNIMTMAAQN